MPSGLVSIVLPVFNGEAYLAEAIGSIRGQTYPHWELIVVDDGSTDRSAAIAREHARADARIRVEQQPNLKLPAALNTGFRSARGDFFTWISADNRMGPDFLARMVGELARHPDWDMVKANMRIIDEHGAPLRGSEHILPFQDPNDSSIIRYPEDTSIMERQICNVVGGAFLYRAHCGRVLGDYDPAYFTAEDYDYWLRMREFFTIRQAGFDEPIYEYRIHPRSLTAQMQALQTVQLSESLLKHHAARLQVYRARLAFSVISAPAAGPLSRSAIEAALRQSGHLVLPPTAATYGNLSPDSAVLHVTTEPTNSQWHFTALICPSDQPVIDTPFDVIARYEMESTTNATSTLAATAGHFRTASLGAALNLIAAKSKVKFGSLC